MWSSCILHGRSYQRIRFVASCGFTFSSFLFLCFLALLISEFSFRQTLDRRHFAPSSCNKTHVSLRSKICQPSQLMLKLLQLRCGKKLRSVRENLVLCVCDKTDPLKPHVVILSTAHVWRLFVFL